MADTFKIDGKVVSCGETSKTFKVGEIMRHFAFVWGTAELKFAMHGATLHIRTNKTLERRTKMSSQMTRRFRYTLDVAAAEQILNHETKVLDYLKNDTTITPPGVLKRRQKEELAHQERCRNED